MLETIVSLITIVSAAFGFYKWILPYLRKHLSKHKKTARRIKISLRGKSIVEKDDFLEQSLLNQKRDVFLDVPSSISMYDPYLDELKNKLKDLSHQDQASLASYISSSEEQIQYVNSMLSILFEKKLLKMLDAIGLSKNELVLIAKGIVQLLDGNVTGRKKFDIWRDSDPQLCFGIYVTPEETKMIETKIDKPVRCLIGPGCLSADELPLELVAHHVIPRILFEITLHKEKLIKHREDLFLLFGYHVGLG